MFQYYRVNFFLNFFIVIGFFLTMCSGFLFMGSGFVLFKEYFIFDSISFYLIILVLFLGVYRQLSFYKSLSIDVCVYLFFSLIFSILCFCVKHSILFWVFYELSMLPLLYLIFKESPYSERFIAGWYFSSYLLITSLPLILVLLYLSFVKGSCFFKYWKVNDFDLFLLVLLSFIFFTKVPLFPFHTWLPIVHAEASSIVSIFLRGYIMKLGLLGVYRCSYYIFNSNFVIYLLLCCALCIFFLVVSSGELDGKRWLAFLSLAHIVIPFLSFFISEWNSIKYAFFYCLGHGLSAGIVFGLLWYFYDLTKSRNWLLLKSGVSKGCLLLLVIFSLLSLCSFPPTIQFFCEVGLIKVSLGFVSYILFWSVYLFLGGLVPLVLCGHLLIRRERVENIKYERFNYFNFLVFLCVWCYLGLFLL